MRSLERMDYEIDHFWELAVHRIESAIRLAYGMGKLTYHSARSFFTLFTTRK